MLDLQQLNYFVAVARTQSIARAAEQLHLSQSPLSRQIIALEARLGLILFVREGKRLKLSPVGQRFLLECEDLLASARQVERRAKQQSLGEAGRLDVAYVESAVRCGAVQHALGRLKAARPNVSVHLHPLRTDAQREALQSGAIDLGFGHRAAPDASGGRSKLLVREPFVLALPRTHALAKRKSITGSLLAGQPFVFVSHQVSPTGRALMLQACRAVGFEPQVQHEVGDPSVALSLVAEGLGLAIVQKSMDSSLPAGVMLRALPNNFPAQLEVHAVIGKHASTMAQELFAHC